MRRRPLVVGAAAFLGCGYLLLAIAPAYADPSTSIRSVSGVDGRLQIVLNGDDLGGQTLDPNSVAVTLDGRSTRATATTVAAARAVYLQRRVVLVIDTSGSMAGAGIEGAKKAASAYLRAAPKDVAVGLVTFADKAQLVAAPSLDRTAVARSIPGLTARGETALYDGVTVALATLGRAGLRSIVLLSDGADTASRAPLAAVLPALKTSGARLDAVAFRTNDAVGATLQQMAGVSSGRLLGAGNEKALTDAFRTAATVLASQVIVNAEVPPELAGRQATVGITVTAGGATLTDEVVTVLPARVATAFDAVPLPSLPPAPPVGFAASEATLVWGLTALFVAVLGIVLLAGKSMNRKERAGGRQRRLLSLYTLTGRPTPVRQETTVLGDSQIAQSALELAGRIARRRGIEERLTFTLERAAVPMRANEWLLLIVAVSSGAMLFLFLLSGSPLGAGLGLVLGALLPGRWLAFKARRRQAAFEEAMPDALQLLAGSLSAGFSFPQAIDAVAREGTEPIAGEFGRAVAEARLGIPVEDSLESIAQRMDSENFHWVVIAVRTQRSVGGNLAEVLTIVAQTMRDRARLQRQVRTLSAEGRMSAYVLIGLPIGIAAYLFTFRNSYVAPLYTEAVGIFMLAGAVVLLGMGWLWMRKIIKVEV